MAVGLLLLLSLVSLSASGPGTEGVNFDFGWRFSKESGVDIHCDNNAFPQNFSSIECLGLRSNDAKSAADCLNACCGQFTCLIWQYSKTKGCWIGQSDDCKHPNKEWLGGGRNSSVTPPIPKQAATNYDDSSWEVIDVPHDGLIDGMYNQSGVQGHGYLPIQMVWYRKHFNLPSDWKGQSIWIEFQGVFRATFVYFNGQRLLYHDSGYTTFLVRLDNATTVNYGTDSENVITLEVHAEQAYSGWWYEGGGIYRHTSLFTTDHVHLVVHGVYGPSQVMGTITDHDPKDPTKGQCADAEFYPLAEVVNENTNKAQVMVSFTLYDEDEAKKGSVTSDAISIDPEGFAIVNLTIPKISQIELWSITRPYFYRLNVMLISASDHSTIDHSNFTIGIRRTQWDPNTGFYLNGKHFTWRGFNNHNDFTGVGVAIPDRLNLFRGQMMRAVGANSWRMSHNPPVRHLLDILDHIGVIVWDENRQYGDNEIWIQNQREMVKRDRNHPSIMVWSFCNEAGCTSGDKDGAAEAFRNVSKQVDMFRPVTANMNGDLKTPKPLTQQIDVQGFSHQSGKTFDFFHQQLPGKPLIGSECCSCQTQRGEDFPDSPKFGSFNGNCNQDETGNQLNRDFVAGCMVWTLFDYYGEPTPGWPYVSSSFGSIDLAGFAKPSAYWYRAWWYYRAKSNTTYNGYDVPINPPSLVDPYSSPSEENSKEDYMIHIVQSWEPVEGKTNRTIQAYTNAKMAELIVNGKSVGKTSVDWQGWAEWRGVPFSAGKITVNALDSQNQVKASHTVVTAGTPTKVMTVIDIPSNRTGTGNRLVLDGQDAGMVSAAIVDANGMVVPSSSANVTFRVVSGPGRIIGVGNGDPSCHEPNHVSWRSAYHGLARAVVQVTQDSSSSSLHRKRLMQIDRDGGLRTLIVLPGDTSTRDTAIVVEASVDGLETSSVSIPVTSDGYNHGILAVAKRSLK
jgi:hypothetical protein